MWKICTQVNKLIYGSPEGASEDIIFSSALFFSIREKHFFPSCFLQMEKNKALENEKEKLSFLKN